jgi:hypothetical protein
MHGQQNSSDDAAVLEATAGCAVYGGKLNNSCCAPAALMQLRDELGYKV